MRGYLFIIPLLLMGMACSHKTTQVNKDKSVVVGYSGSDTQNQSEILEPATLTPIQSRYMPKATAFRMSGDYADNVAVTVGADGNLTYFPDPKDITADSEPLNLGNGWWLNRQGLGKNSVFTKYKFDEYAELPQVPSLQQLKNAIIPGARFNQIIELPYSIGEASENIPLIIEYLKDK